MTTRQIRVGALASLLLLVFFAIDPLAIRALPALPEIVVAASHKLTALGNSAWLAVLLPLIALAAAFTEIRSQSPSARRCASVTLRLAVALFLFVLLSGIAVQLLKHSFGRARPEWFAELGPYALRPYGFDFSFNSFPSGHATTVGAVAMFLCWLFPRWVTLIAAIAVIIAGTRIVTGSHYPSDVLVGLALGAGTTWLLGRALLLTGQIPPRHDPVFDRIGSRNLTRSARFARGLSWTAWTRDPLYLSLLIGTLIAMNAAMVIFFSAPQIDIAASGLFFDAERGFWMAENQTLTVIRYIFLRGTQLVALAALVLYLIWWRLGRRMQIPIALPAYAAACFAIGPGLLVNGVFKSHWGRARPANIEAFGGDMVFTLPFERADQCLSNCSFPSGEGSAIAMLAIVVGSIFWPWLRRRGYRVWPVGLAIALFGIALRVAMGRHFLSDSVFAVLLMVLIALIAYRWCGITAIRPQLTRAALHRDMASVKSYLTSPYRAPVPSLASDLYTLLLAAWRVLTTTGALLRAMTLGVWRQLRGLWLSRAKPMQLEPGE